MVSPTLGGFPVPSTGATVNVKMRVGLDKYCMAFTGTGDGSKFLVKDAAASPSCPVTPGCTGEFVGGACWFIGEAGESCDDTCMSLGKTCDPATETFAGRGGPNGCAAVVTALLIDAVPSELYRDTSGTGCIVFPLHEDWDTHRPPPSHLTTGAATTCGAAAPGVHRICACM